MLTRRQFVAFAAAATAAPRLSAARLPIKKAVLLSMLPLDMPRDDRLKMARDVGFEEMEAPTFDDPQEEAALGKAAVKAGLRIHSVMNRDHWRYPLSAKDPAVVEKSRQGMLTSLRNAQAWGADTVLLVPAVVNPETSYQDAWTRSQSEIRKLIPEAEKRKVIIAVEEVWNKFLLSPLEFARYVDDFQSPWVKAYFDVGNVVLYGYPQDWIRTLGPRIVKLHFKDFAFRQDPTVKKRVADFVNLRDGEIQWPAIHQALADIGYKGTATVELAGGETEYLRDVSKRFDLILQGQ